jgi:hypothetical protein
MGNWNALANDILFLQAPAERSAYLDEACGGDAELHAGVESLLAAHGKAESFLESPASSIVSTRQLPHCRKIRHDDRPDESATRAASEAHDAKQAPHRSSISHGAGCARLGKVAA